MPMTVVLYVLECEHIMPDGPETSGAVICKLCNVARRVTDVHVYEWRVRCRECNFARWTGLSKQTADNMANKHAAGMQHSKVQAEYAANPLAVKARKRLTSHQVI